MPIVTPHYGLEAHTRGEFYSASRDRRRFITIDNELAFISDLIGGGKISGWDVSVEDLSALELNISQGFGIIDRTVSLTFNDLIVTVPDNTTSYLYFQKREVLGGTSGFSKIKSIQFSDDAAPSTPSGLVSSSITYKSIDLAWTANTEADISGYNIYRSLNNIDYSLIATVYDNSYSDTNVSENTNYYYKISAFDLSGNEGSQSSSLIVKTLKDLRKPLSPEQSMILDGDGEVQIAWFESPSSYVSKYRVYIKEINEFGDILDDLGYSEVNSSKSNISIGSLINNRIYRFNLVALSYNNVESESTSLIGKPAFEFGPYEVSNISVSYREGDSDDSNLIMEVSWAPPVDPYVEMPEKYQIKIIDGQDTSIAIPVSAGFTKDIKVIPFNNNGTTTYRTVQEDHLYFVIIQSIDENDNISRGRVAISRSISFRKPSQSSSPFVEELTNGNLFATWKNSISNLFSYNSLSITANNNSDGSVTTIASDLNIGSANSYTINAEDVLENNSYDYEIVSVDKFGNESDALSFSYDTFDQQDFERPDVPSGQSIQTVNNSIIIKWNKMNDAHISNYNIWRSEFNYFATENSFSLIQTVPSSLDSYQDFDVESGTRYMYFVTAVDDFGQESQNPIDDDFISYPLLVAKARNNSTFETPENVSISRSGFDAIVEWENLSGSFDGFQIYRSINNKYSFELVGQVGRSTSSFTDENALLVDDNIYYYIVRKVRNEVDPLVLASNIPPANSLFLAKITTDSGSITIDQTDSVNLANYEDPIRTETRKQLSVHNHLFGNDGIDRRIDLSSDVSVEDWSTSDYQTFTTTESLSGTSLYMVTLSGDANEDFFSASSEFGESSLEQLKNGISPFLFDVDVSNKKLVFEIPLYGSTGVFPFLTEPSVSLSLVNVNEVQGILPENRIKSISASQFGSGNFNTNQFEKISHDGRIDEVLKPITEETETFDSFTYEIKDRSKAISNSITFYSVKQVSGDTLVAATSQGICKSQDFGSSWEVIFVSPTAPADILYSTYLDKYFAITSRAVYVSSGDLTNWRKTLGLDNIKTCRDIVEDSGGNLFISTDLGVYKLDVLNTSDSILWKQTPQFDATSSEAYSLVFDDNNLIANNGVNIFISNNSGVTWATTSQIDEPIIFNKMTYDEKVFAVSSTKIWRRDGGSFLEVEELDVNAIENIIVFSDRLYVSTDKGVYASDSSNNIYTDSSLSMIRILPELNVNNNAVVAHSLNIIDNKMFIGTDQSLYVRNSSDRTYLQYQNQEGKIPTVYKDGIEQKIGFRYVSSGGNISFIRRANVESEVSVAISYKQYYISNGWSHQKYNSRVIIFLNNNIYRDSLDSYPDGFILDTSVFSDFEFPSYTDRNANVKTADEYKAISESLISIVTSGDTSSYAVSQAVVSIERFMSQIYTALRVDTPDVVMSLETDDVSISRGIVTFENEFNKYDNIKISIIGSSLSNIGDLSKSDIDCGVHKILEDRMELINSGLPSSLSQIQQSNIIKMGMYNERQWPGEQSECSTPYQAKYVSPVISDYDILNSSIDYTLQISQDTTSLTIPYPAGLAYIESDNKVFIGGLGGLFSIDVDTFDIEEMTLPESKPEVKDIKEHGDYIYVLTGRFLYKSSDFGSTWITVERSGLGNNLFSLEIIHNRLVVGAADGVYYKTIEQGVWNRALSSNTPVDIMSAPDLLFVLVDSQFYYSSNGVEYIKTGSEQNDIINNISKYKSLIYLATEKGLKSDDGTLYGIDAGFSSITLPDSVQSLSVNDIQGDSDKLVVGICDGHFVYLYNDEFTLDNSQLDTVHKILLIDKKIWLFGYDSFMVFNDPISGDGLEVIPMPIKLTTGIPL